MCTYCCTVSVYIYIYIIYYELYSIKYYAYCIHTHTLCKDIILYIIIHILFHVYAALRPSRIIPATPLNKIWLPEHVHRDSDPESSKTNCC